MWVFRGVHLSNCAWALPELLPYGSSGLLASVTNLPRKTVCGMCHARAAIQAATWSGFFGHDEFLEWKRVASYIYTYIYVYIYLSLTQRSSSRDVAIFITSSFLSSISNLHVSNEKNVLFSCIVDYTTLCYRVYYIPLWESLLNSQDSMESNKGFRCSCNYWIYFYTYYIIYIIDSLSQYTYKYYIVYHQFTHIFISYLHVITGIQWYIQPHDITLWLPRGMSWPCRMPNGCWWVYLSNQRNHGFRLMRLGPSKKSMAELVGFLDGLADPKNHGISSHWWGLEMFGDPCERHIQSPCRVQWFLGWMENKRIKSEFRISPRWIKFVVRNFRSYTTVKDLIFVFWECCLFLNRITVWFWAFSCNNGEFLRFHCCSCFSPLPFNDWVVIYVYPIIQEVFWCIKKGCSLNLWLPTVFHPPGVSDAPVSSICCKYTVYPKTTELECPAQLPRSFGWTSMIASKKWGASSFREIDVMASQPQPPPKLPRLEITLVDQWFP